jgi:hypothetical protein
LCPSGISGSVREGQFIAKSGHTTPLIDVSTTTATVCSRDYVERCEGLQASEDVDQIAVG